MKGFNTESHKKNAPSKVEVVLEQPEVAVPTEPEAPKAETPAETVNPFTTLFGESSQNIFASYAPNGLSSAFGGNVLGNRNILVVTPRTVAETMGVIEHLRTGEACIVCLEGLPVSDAQRRVDFLNGVVCAFSGTMKPLDTNKFILTPNGVGVRATQPI